MMMVLTVVCVFILTIMCFSAGFLVGYTLQKARIPEKKVRAPTMPEPTEEEKFKAQIAANQTRNFLNYDGSEMPDPTKFEAKG